MIAELIHNPGVLILAGAVVAYIALLRLVDRLEYRRMEESGEFTDQWGLERLAVIRRTSEYEVFGWAAERWRVSEDRKEDDFKAYLRCGNIPHYVRDYVRDRKEEIEKSYKPKFPFNDSLPPSWSA